MTNRILFSGVVFALGCSAGTEQTEQTVSAVAPAEACDWTQSFGTSDHAGMACPEQNGLRKVAEILQDEDWSAEVDAGGFLQVHEGAALTSGDFLVVPTKHGFTSALEQDTVQYGLTAYRWTPSVMAPNRTLIHAWDASTDFVTVDGMLGFGAGFTFITNGYVQEHGLALANGSAYSMAKSGTLLRYSLADGSVQARINPFAGTSIDGDNRLTVDAPPTIDDSGNLYYTTTAWPLGDSPFGQNPRGSWLVKVAPSNAVQVVDWTPDNAIKLGGTPIASNAVGVPVHTDATCEWPFFFGGTPGPVDSNSKPVIDICATQRPALNAPVAYSPVTRHLVAYSYSNNIPGVGFLIEIDATTLQSIRSADLRNNNLRYACGVRLDANKYPGCRRITNGGTVNIGNDPDFNSNVHLRTPADIMDNAPSISPDGKLWSIGSYDGGFSFEGELGFLLGYDARGSAILYNSDGSFAANNPEFAWEVTPSWLPVFATTNTIGAPPLSFDILQDRGLYSLGHLGVARYDSHFRLKSVGEAPDQLFGDFVDTNIPFGRNGDHYGVTEFGVLYKFDAASNIVETLQITDEPIEVLSGQISRDRAGDLIISYAGRVHVVASGAATPSHAAPRTSKRLAAGQIAKIAASMPVTPPAPR